VDVVLEVFTLQGYGKQAGRTLEARSYSGLDNVSYSEITTAARTTTTEGLCHGPGG
jgi:hypothetical protein